MYKADDIASEEWPLADNAGIWLRAKPEPEPLIVRIKGAWKVLTGECVAVSFNDRKSK